MKRSMPKAIVTGGAEGIGKDIVDFFNGSIGVSRRTGHDIRNQSVRDKLIEDSLNYNMFINLAHDGEFAQTKLLYELFNKWEQVKKEGYIINIGSIATLDLKRYERYAIVKYSLDTASHQCSRKISDTGLNFKCSIIRPSLLDIPKSHKKKSWKGIGVRGKNIAKTIQYLWSTPKNLQITDIIIDSIINP